MTTVEVVGVREPRVLSVPHAVDYSIGDKAIELGELAGIRLFDWQADRVREALALDHNGKWAAFEVVWLLPRQNGKNAGLEVLQLAKLFIVEEPLQIHSAHLADTSNEAFLRLQARIEETPVLAKRVQAIHRTNGKEGITLRNGCRIKFKTRTAGGGRGLSANTLYGDEAYNFPEATHGALFPVMSAQSVTGNPQMVFTSSAVDQTMPGHEHGVVLARLRERGHAAAADPARATVERINFAEYSVDEDELRGNPDLADDPRAWAQANPSAGHLISGGHIKLERASMADRTFYVERLGVGDWPDTTGGEQIIDAVHLAATRDEQSQPAGAVVFTVDVTPDRLNAAIGAAGFRPDGLAHIEVVEHRAGTSWVVGRVAELLKTHESSPAVYLDGKGPAGSLMADLVAAGVEVVDVSASEHAKACGMLFDAFTGAGSVDEQGEPLRTVRHIGQPDLLSAIRGAKKRRLSDAWAWDRKTSGGNIAPLVAVTLAYGALRSGAVEKSYYDDHDLIVLD